MRIENHKSLAEALNPPLDEAEINAAWKGTQTRLHAPSRGSTVVPVGVGVLILLLLLMGQWFFESPNEYLVLNTGSVPAAATATVLRFKDGSVVEVGQNAWWIPTLNNATRFESKLERGVAIFDIEPGGERAWVIHAGPTTIKVLGTRFIVRGDEHCTEVRVERGRVQVTDTRENNRTHILHKGNRFMRCDDQLNSQRPTFTLTPGQSGVSGDHKFSTTGGQHSTGTAVVTRSQPAQSAMVPMTPVASPRPSPQKRNTDNTHKNASWTGLAAQGAYAEAFETLGRIGFRREAEQATPTELLQLADVSRLSGRPLLAVEALERLLRLFPDDAQAPLAALTLGRLEMDELHRVERARAAFRRALKLGIPRALLDDTQKRLQHLDTR